MHLTDYNTTRRFTGTLVKSHRLTPVDMDEVRELEFVIESPPEELKPGQSIGVIVPGPHSHGQSEHFRLYTLAGIVRGTDGRTHVEILVKRCTYLDPYSGEAYPGVASHYLCDSTPGDRVTLAGPFGLPFTVPADRKASLLMIGMGTGIAPFRAFVRHIYDSVGGWEGKVRLFYGARTGLELVYMNDARNDFANYYDQATFRAFTAVSRRPHRDEPPALHDAMLAHREEVWDMVNGPNTYVYVAGLEAIGYVLDEIFATMEGSHEGWRRFKQELVRAGRWSELIY
jgi:ferredoxin--NADP+ reductase